MAPDDDENYVGLDLSKTIKVTSQRRKKKRAEVEMMIEEAEEAEAEEAEAEEAEAEEAEAEEAEEEEEEKEEREPDQRKMRSSTKGGRRNHIVPQVQRLLVGGMLVATKGSRMS